MPKLNQKGVVHLLLPIILLLGLIAGVYLVTSGNPLKFFSKASNDPIVLKDENGNPLPKQGGNSYTSRSAKVKVEITSTLGPPSSVSSPISPNQPSATTQQINLLPGQPNSFGLTVKVKDGYKASDLVNEIKQSFKPQDSRYQDPRRDFIMAVRGHDSQTNRPLIYNPRNPQQPGNSDFPVKVGEGYIIDVQIPGSSTIQGQTLTSPITINIPRGRSLIAFPAIPNTVKTASDLVSELRRRDIRIMAVTSVTQGANPFRPERPQDNNFSILPAAVYYLDNASPAKDWVIRDVPQPAQATQNPNPNVQTTLKYRIAESPVELSRAPEVAYTSEPTMIDYEFKNVTERARKYIFVEFIANNGRRDGRQVTVDILLPRPTPAPSGYTLVPYPTNNVTIKIGDPSVSAEYGVYAFLKDQSGRSISDAENAANFSYSWQNSNEVAVSMENRNVCTNGEGRPSCPLQYAYLKGKIAGTSTISVTVTNKQTGQRVASTTISALVSQVAPTPTPVPQAISKRVFVTSATYNGNLGGLSGADAKCQARANAANLGGTWKAWLSDSTTPVNTRFKASYSSPYKLVNGTVVADNWSDLTDGTIKSMINVTELNTIATDNVGDYYAKLVWTNSKPDGYIYNTYQNCSSWTVADRTGGGRVGWWSLTGPEWTVGNNVECSGFARLYCFEQ